MSGSPALAGDGSLADLLDRVIGGGAVLAGDAVIGLAGVDLIRLDLRLLLASVETLRRTAGTTSPEPRADGEAGQPPAGQTSRRAPAPAPPPPAAGTGSAGARPGPGPLATGAPMLPPDPPPLPRIDADTERGLSRLVLAVVELLRQLMERQAMRRVLSGSLSAEEVERLGLALMGLEARMDRLREAFGIDRDDLQLTLDRIVA